MGKEQVVEFQEGLLYSDDVQNAVRYGYQYRKEAEEHESGSAHACLSNAPEILLWLGQKVVEGLAWDLFKELKMMLMYIYLILAFLFLMIHIIKYVL